MTEQLETQEILEKELAAKPLEAAADEEEVNEIQDMLEMMRELDGSEGYIYAWEDERQV